ncbi:MAG: polymer-forming cytoskeletal protein [Tissierellales bacterium]
MFKKSQDNIDTFVGKNTKISGKIEAKGAIRIDGEIVGDIFSEGNITIGIEGKVTGNLEGDSIFISGTVNGNLKCHEHLRLGNTSKLVGDVEVKTLIIDENAIFEGKCMMESMSSDKIKEKPNKEKKGA